MSACSQLALLAVMVSTGTKVDRVAGLVITPMTRGLVYDVDNVLYSKLN